MIWYSRICTSRLQERLALLNSPNIVLLGFARKAITASNLPNIDNVLEESVFSKMFPVIPTISKLDFLVENRLDHPACSIQF